jgi:hypothetical protein
MQCMLSMIGIAMVEIFQCSLGFASFLSLHEFELCSLAEFQQPLFQFLSHYLKERGAKGMIHS